MPPDHGDGPIPRHAHVGQHARRQLDHGDQARDGGEEQRDEEDDHEEAAARHRANSCGTQMNVSPSLPAPTIWLAASGMSENTVHSTMMPASSDTLLLPKPEDERVQRRVLALRM
jgi:hypothetical protein